MNGTVMPGWEPERMAHVKELFDRALGAAYVCGLWEAVEKELGPRG